MPVSRNDACPCGSGKKYKKCCLGAPDADAVRRSRIFLYATLALIVATGLAFLLVGQGVGSAVGLGSFVLLIGYALGGGASAAARGTGRTAPPAPARRARR